jgi:site-specific recombinase XerD
MAVSPTGSEGGPASVGLVRLRAYLLRHAHALELAREGVPLNIIQLGHVNLGTTSIYLQGIDPEEIIAAVRTRSAPMMSASAELRL